MTWVMGGRQRMTVPSRLEVCGGAARGLGLKLFCQGYPQQRATSRNTPVL